MFFLQEKNGNILVGGYPPSPSIGKRPIYFRFFLLKASLNVNTMDVVVNDELAALKDKNEQLVGKLADVELPNRNTRKLYTICMIE